MTVFVDTSALYALFDRDDANHAAARSAWEQLLQSGDTLVTNNYVMVETTALIQHRLGIAAVRALHEDVLPLFEIDWITREQHGSGTDILLAMGRKKVSLVDCISFQTMRGRTIRTAFAFDAHFNEQAFELIP